MKKWLSDYLFYIVGSLTAFILYMIRFYKVCFGETDPTNREICYLIGGAFVCLLWFLMLYFAKVFNQQNNISKRINFIAKAALSNEVDKEAFIKIMEEDGDNKIFIPILKEKIE